MAVLVKPRRPVTGRPPADSHPHVQVADAAIPAVRRQWIALLTDLAGQWDHEHAAHLATFATPAIAAGATAPELQVAKRLPSLSQLAGTLADIVSRVARQVLGAGRTPALAIEGSFGLVNTHAVTWAEQHAAALVRGVDAQTRSTIATLIARGQQGDLAVDEMARQIRPLIGLTTPQATAALNYRDMLVSAQMRDRYGQPAAQTVGNAFALSPWRGGRLDQDRIDRLYRQYAGRQLAWRAETIARTETIAAATEGRRLGWDTEIAAGGVDGHRLVQTWSVTNDDRACEECLGLDGETIESDDITPGRRQSLASMGTFPGGLDGPPAHASCRCVCVMSVE